MPPYGPNLRLGDEPRLKRSQLGWQDVVRGGGSTSLQDQAGIAPLMGRALPAGTYTFALPVSGAAAIDVTLRLATLAGGVTVPTARLFRTLVDGLTEKLDATGASTAVAFPALPAAGGTMRTGSLTGIRGEQIVALEITVPAGETATFDLAEYTAS